MIRDAPACLQAMVLHSPCCPGPWICAADRRNVTTSQSASAHFDAIRHQRTTATQVAVRATSNHLQFHGSTWSESQPPNRERAGVGGGEAKRNLPGISPFRIRNRHRPGGSVGFAHTSSSDETSRFCALTPQLILPALRWLIPAPQAYRPR